MDAPGLVALEQVLLTVQKRRFLGNRHEMEKRGAMGAGDQSKYAVSLPKNAEH